MIRNFIIIGMDDNREPFFPPEVLRHIREGKVFSGGLRHREIVEKLLPEGAEWISITVPLDNVFAQYENIFADFEKTASDASIVVFASGDPLFFGFANTVKRKLPDAKIRLYPAFNSLQTLAHRLVMPYDDMRTVSLTGRPWQELDKALIERAHKIGVLTDREHTPATIAARMLEYVVVTTLNVNLQQIASDAFGKNRGAVIAIEPDTGKILCMVSKPSFDPNKVAANWNDLVNGDSTEARLLNRATQGLYPPGSTFKIVTALEYMREHPSAYNDYHYDCSGIFSFENNKIQCYHKKAHGSQDFTQAFANSCNGAFANLGTELELTSYRNLAEQLLFNRSLPLDIPYNKSTFSMQPDAETWEVLQTSIGQGQTLMSPMHNLLITAAIANGGILMKPYLMDHVENSGGDVIRKFSPSVAGELMVPNEADALKNLMVQVVNVGTGSALKRDSYQVAGKTGSAEFDKGKETHAWFVGFAPADDPKIAVCVIVEEGGSGGHTAAPIAAKLFDAWLQ